MSYIASPWNHLRAVRAWAGRNGGRARIDVSTFQVEVRAHNRYFTLHPQFYARHDGRTVYVSDPASDGIVGFAGWLPYRPVRWQLSADKTAFDVFARRSGLRRPTVWLAGSQPDGWYLAKAPHGSFGDQVRGPFPPSYRQDDSGHSDSFHEAFVPGRNLKVWFWGPQPFFAHLHDYPSIVGDGERNVRALLPSRDPVDDSALVACLAFQGLMPESVPLAGKPVWTEFRYGRRPLLQHQASTSDDQLAGLHGAVREQIDELGAAMWSELSATFRVPLLYSVDGVVDGDRQVWWLEANANPSLPPEGYELILGTLCPAPADKARAA